MSEQQQRGPTATTAPDNTRRWTLIGAAAAAVAGLGAFAAHRRAHAAPMGFGPHGGWHGAMGDADPAVAAKRIDAMVAYLLAEVDATPEQRERIGVVLKGAANDLQASRKQHMQARRQSLELLAAPTIDRARLEKLRIEQMQLADTTSRRMLQAMLDSAEMLTAEQRVKLVERWQRRTPPRQ